MEQERAAQRARKKTSVPMTAASDFAVPEGTDELSRNTRRAWRDRLNDAQTRKMITGVLATLAGGSFWGFSGTSASFLFDTYHVDTLWLMSIRQILAGLWLSRTTAHAWSSFGRRPLIASSCCSLPLLACSLTSFAIFRPCA